MRADALQARDAVDHVACKVKSVQIVENSHIERSGRCSFLFVSANVKVVVIRAPISQAVNQPRISVVGEDNRLVRGEERGQLTVGKAGGMLGGGLDGHRANTSATP